MFICEIWWGWVLERQVREKIEKKLARREKVEKKLGDIEILEKEKVVGRERERESDRAQ